MAQAPVVFASLVGVKQGQLGLLVGAGEHSIRESLARLRQVQKWDVLQTQKQVKFGDDHKHLAIVESDEVSLRSRLRPGRKIWQRYLAIMERGIPANTVLERLPKWYRERQRTGRRRSHESA